MGRAGHLLIVCVIGCFASGCASGEGRVLRHEAEDGQATVRYEREPYTKEELAALFVGRTVLVHDANNGNEVTYFAEDGEARLWHPTQRRVVRGGWRLQGREFCVRFGTRGFNPITLGSASIYACEPLARFERRIVASQTGDAFGLADGSPPKRLRRRPLYPTLEALQAEIGD